MPRPLRYVVLIIALAAIALGPIAAATDVIPPVAHRWLLLALSSLILLRDGIPVLYARFFSDAPAVEPPRVADTIAKVGVVLLALAAPAHAIPVPGVVLTPGPAEVQAEEAAPKLPAIRPGTLGPAGWYALAQADTQPAPQPPAPPVVAQPAIAPLPTVPPAALSPCEVCAGQIGAAVAKPAKDWPTWAKVLAGIGGAALAGLEVARQAGAFK